MIGADFAKYIDSTLLVHENFLITPAPDVLSDISRIFCVENLLI
jgi:hypothetical protein